jgi:capsular polysaccharide biosynthesis protein
LELSEVIGRIFGRHRRLIAALILAGLLAGFMIHLGDAARYSASARLVLDTSDPEDQAQSGVIADTTRAIASGPSLVREALAEIGVQRNATELARRHVQVQALGSSGVMQLTVTDSDPQVAVSLANAIAKAVIRARLQVTAGEAAAVVRQIDQQLTRLQRQISDLDAQIDQVGAQAGAAAAGSQLVRRREALAQRMSQLENERASVETTRALRPRAAVLDAASLPAQRLPGRRLPDLVLGGLLGLLVGVGAAAAIESLRPTLVGRTAIARGIEAPVLAELSGPPQRRGHRHGWVAADVAEAAMHVELVAVAAGVQQVRLMALDRQVDLSNLVQILGDSLKTATVQQADMPTARRRPGSRAGLELEAPQPEADGGRIGLVLVAPTVLKLADLDPVKDFLTISGWPLLGVIVYQSPRRKALVPGVQRATPSTDTYSEVDV